MEECNKDSNQNEIESKPKKGGFFRRLKRGFTSIFQRKNNRKRNKSEPCIPGIPDESIKPDGNDETRLSLKNDENNENPDENGGEQSSGCPPFRPVAKAPIFVNDFTAELKKSLLQRSKMVEEGQTSEAIVQIEMTRSNYSTNEEENPAKIENKTFEEKVALFESQISGGSLHNSLKRNSKLSENKQEIAEEKEDGDNFASLNENAPDKEKEDGDNFASLNENAPDKENDDNVTLEISEVVDTETMDSDVKEVEYDYQTDGFTNYELTMSKDQEEQNKVENINSLETNEITDDFSKLQCNDDNDDGSDTIKTLNEENNDSHITEKENCVENCQISLTKEKESRNCVEELNNGILINESNSV